MKKIMILMTVLVALTLGVQSCKKSSPDPGNGTEVPQDAKTAKLTLKNTQGIEYAAGEEYGIFMFKDNLSSQTTIKGVVNLRAMVSNSVVDGDVATAKLNEDKTIVLPKSDTTVQFFAYAPYDKELTGGGIGLNVSEQTDPIKLFRYAESQPVAISESTPKVLNAELVSHEVMSSIEIYVDLKQGVSLDDYKNMTATVSGVPSSAKFNIATKTLAEQDSGATINYQSSRQFVDGRLVMKIAMLPHTTDENAEIVLKKSSGAVVFSKKLSEIEEFEAGFVYFIQVEIAPEKVSVSDFVVKEFENDNSVTGTEENIKIAIPDAAFKSYLVAEFDRNGDGEIDSFEANYVWKIDVAGKSEIKSMEGLKYFHDLRELHCSGIGVSELDLSPLKVLYRLDCSDATELTTLDISGCADLKFINTTGAAKLKTVLTAAHPLLRQAQFGNTSVEKLDFSRAEKLETLEIQGCTKIKHLNISNTLLRSLALSHVADLEVFIANDAVITSVDLSQLKRLNTLELKNARFLESLKVLGCDALKKVEFSETLVADLNFGSMQSLEDFKIFNNENLTQLDLSNNPKLNSADIKTNAKLATLNIQNSPELTVLVCVKSDIKSIDLSTNKKLIKVDLSMSEGLEALNLAENKLLESLNITITKVATLDVSGLNKLQYLTMINSGTETLKADGCTMLRKVECQWNPSLTALNVSTWADNIEIKWYHTTNDNSKSFSITKRASQNLKLFNNKGEEYSEGVSITNI